MTLPPCALVTDSGVDTVSFGYRPPGSAWFEAVDGFRHHPHRFGPAGALIAEERGPDGGRLMCWPANGVLGYETRLGALLALDVDEHRLVSASGLQEAEGNARAVFQRRLGVGVGPSEVRRYDLTGELRFGTSSDGLAFLRTLGGLRPPRSRVEVISAPDGQVMTVYVRTLKRGVVQLRAYDKGRECGSDPPGLRVRIESQNLPPKSKRRTPEALSASDLRATFGRTMTPYLHAEEITAAGPDGATRLLVQQAVNGELSYRRAEWLLGSLQLLRAYGRSVYDQPDESRKTNDKRSSLRLRALREAGISLDDELPADSLVPVTALLRDVVDRFTA